MRRADQQRQGSAHEEDAKLGRSCSSGLGVCPDRLIVTIATAIATAIVTAIVTAIATAIVTAIVTASARARQAVVVDANDTQLASTAGSPALEQAPTILGRLPH